MNFYNENMLYYEPTELRKNDLVRNGCRMSSGEQAFLCQLLKETRPKKILEVGTLLGGTTAIILRCLELLNIDTYMYSIDILKSFIDSTDDIGKEKEACYIAKKIMPHLKNKWEFIGGHTVAKSLEYIGKDIDFVILDAAHILPGELLDFVAILPYLKEGAMIVTHDIRRAQTLDTATWYATNVLFSSVVAEKYLVKRTDNQAIYNIAAFKTTADTKKYIDNLLQALSMPWGYDDSEEHRREYDQCIKQNYSEEQYQFYLNCCLQGHAVMMNTYDFDEKALLKILMDKSKKLIIFGFGLWGCRFYSWIESGLHYAFMQGMLKYEYVDNNKDLWNNSELPISVASPDILHENKNVQAVIVTAMDENAIKSITTQLEELNPDLKGKIFNLKDFVI